MNVPAVTPADFARMDALAEPGLSIVYPGAYDSLLRDYGGWRSWLADHDIALTIRGTALFNYDVLQNNPHTNPQAYAGQQFTAQSESLYPTLTVGLGRLGLPDSKIEIGAITFGSTWPVSQGHSKPFSFDKFAVDQSLFNQAVEIKVGYLVNYLEFIGVFTGGSPLLATGLSSLVPIETGLSADPAPSPTVNVSLYGPQGSYFKGGIQRSVSPLGAEYTADHSGSVGLDFGATHASALYITEFGVHQQSSAANPSLWLRTGFLYNTSKYARLTDGRYTENYSYYLLGDYQFYKPYPSMAYRGIYGGFSVFDAKPSVNVFSQYYELRLYSIGLFESRPADGITLNVNHSVFSHQARYAYAFYGVNAPSGELEVTGSYSAHIVRGLYIAPNASYVHHPAFGAFRDAFVLGANIFVNF